MPGAGETELTCQQPDLTERNFANGTLTTKAQRHEVRSKNQKAL